MKDFFLFARAFLFYFILNFPIHNAQSSKSVDCREEGWVPTAFFSCKDKNINQEIQSIHKEMIGSVLNKKNSKSNLLHNSKKPLSSGPVFCTLALSFLIKNDDGESFNIKKTLKISPKFKNTINSFEEKTSENWQIDEFLTDEENCCICCFESGKPDGDKADFKLSIRPTDYNKEVKNEVYFQTDRSELNGPTLRRSSNYYDKYTDLFINTIKKRKEFYDSNPVISLENYPTIIDKIDNCKLDDLFPSYITFEKCAEDELNISLKSTLSEQSKTENFQIEKILNFIQKKLEENIKNQAKIFPDEFIKNMFTNIVNIESDLFNINDRISINDIKKIMSLAQSLSKVEINKNNIDYTSLSQSIKSSISECNIKDIEHLRRIISLLIQKYEDKTQRYFLFLYFLYKKDKKNIEIIHELRNIKEFKTYKVNQLNKVPNDYMCAEQLMLDILSDENVRQSIQKKLQEFYISNNNHIFDTLFHLAVTKTPCSICSTSLNAEVKKEDGILKTLFKINNNGTLLELPFKTVISIASIHKRPEEMIQTQGLFPNYEQSDWKKLVKMYTIDDYENKYIPIILMSKDEDKKESVEQPKIEPYKITLSYFINPTKNKENKKKTENKSKNKPNNFQRERKKNNGTQPIQKNEKQNSEDAFKKFIEVASPKQKIWISTLSDGMNQNFKEFYLSSVDLACGFRAFGYDDRQKAIEGIEGILKQSNHLCYEEVKKIIENEKSYYDKAFQLQTLQISDELLIC